MPLFEIKKEASIGLRRFGIGIKEYQQPVEQIRPAGAESNPRLLQELDYEICNSDDWVYETKYDGERLLLHFDSKTKDVRATTRRQSSKTGLMNEQTNKVPHLRSIYLEKLQGTILDGEVIYLGTDTNTGSIMRSNPERAIELQKQHGWVTFVAFDVIQYKGEDVRGLPWSYRLRRLEDVMSSLYEADPGCAAFVQTSSPHAASGYKKAFEIECQEGREGVILKRKNSKYGENHAWIKVKKEETYDAFVTGWEKGQGRNSSVAGYINFSVLDENGNEIEVARVGALDDDLRYWVAKDYASYHHQVAELKAQEVTVHNRLRHPRLVRWREDIGVQDCTYEKFIRGRV